MFTYIIERPSIQIVRHPPATSTSHTFEVLIYSLDIKLPFSSRAVEDLVLGAISSEPAYEAEVEDGEGAGL